MNLDDALSTDDTLLGAQWVRLQAWLAPRFGTEAVGMEAILFLVGVQMSGEGYRKLEKEAKQDTIMNGTYAVFERIGLYARDPDTPEGWRRTADVPELSIEQQEKLLRVAVVRFFAEYVEDLPDTVQAER